MNAKRRMRARGALVGGGYSLNDGESAIVDLIADLLHLADHQHYDTAQIVRIALTHLQTEKTDDHGIQKAGVLALR